MAEGGFPGRKGEGDILGSKNMNRGKEVRKPKTHTLYF